MTGYLPSLHLPLPPDSGLRIPDDDTLRRVGAAGGAVLLHTDGTHTLVAWTLWNGGRPVAGGAS